MGSIFVSLLNVSITASYVAIAAILLRVALKNAPKWISCLLWAFVAFRLLCPVSFESMFSLIPETEPITVPSISAPNEQRPMGGNGNINNDTNIQAPPVSVPTIPANPNTQVNTDTNPNSADTKAVAVTVFSYVWLAGLAAMLLYAVISYAKLRMKVKEAVREKEVWVTDKAETPFVLGVIRPRIYIPEGMNEADREYVTAHEKAHIRRLDHVWKPLGYVLLTVHWFNPIMWVVYYYLCRDIELACDEKVIKEKGESCKVGYTTALINCSASRRRISACPLAFGETAAKERVKTVLSYKKPTFWIIVVALVACAVTAVLLLTDKPEEKPNEDESNVSSTDESKDESSKDESNSAGTDNSTPHNHEEWLQQHYGDFYNLNVDEGLFIYVSQFGPNSYYFHFMPGRSTPYNFMELLESIGTTMGVDAMDARNILGTYLEKYDLAPETEIRIIPYSNPLSSYISIMGDCVVYLENIREMLGLPGGMYSVEGDTYVQEVRGICEPVRGELMRMANDNTYIKPASSDEDFPLVEIHSKEDLWAFLHAYAEDMVNDDVEYFSRYDDKFFEKRTLLMSVVSCSSGSMRVFVDNMTYFNGRLELDISTDCPEIYTSDMKYWYIVKEIQNSTLERCTSYAVFESENYVFLRPADGKESPFINADISVIDNTKGVEIINNVCDERLGIPLDSLGMDVGFISNKSDFNDIFREATLTTAIPDGYDDEYFKKNDLLVIKCPTDPNKGNADFKVNIYSRNGMQIYVELLHSAPHADSEYETVLLLSVAKGTIKAEAHLCAYAVENSAVMFH